MKQTTREHLLSIIKDFDTAMLTTLTPEGCMRARPLQVAEIDADNQLYFSTAIDSGKVKELEGDPRVCIAMQGKMKYASLSGRARVSQDRALIERLYKEDWKVFFPGGKTDPTLAILIVDPIEGEYWDNSGLSGVRFLIEAAKAYVKGERHQNTTDDNAKVKL
jgi:general stress protein 26